MFFIFCSLSKAVTLTTGRIISPCSLMSPEPQNRPEPGAGLPLFVVYGIKALRTTVWKCFIKFCEALGFSWEQGDYCPLHLVQAAVQLSSRWVFSVWPVVVCITSWQKGWRWLYVHPLLSTPRFLFFLLCLNQLRQHVVVLRGNMWFLLVGTGCLAPWYALGVKGRWEGLVG